MIENNNSASTRSLGCRGSAKAMRDRIGPTVVVVALLAAAVASGQVPQPPDPPEAMAHVAAAARIGGADLATTARMLCLPSRETIREMLADAAAHGPQPPAKVFDNLYYVGARSVGSWAITTSAGIILIDALDNPKEAEDQIVGGLRKLGLDPASIKYVVVTHAHGDHFGGAKYLRETFGARIAMSEADWKQLEQPAAQPMQGSPRWGPPPARDMVLADGQTLTLGETTITVVLTPGHTPGTVSLMVPVKDHGVRHVAALWGGTGQPGAGPASDQYEASLLRFAAATDRAGVDVGISNHPLTDGGLVRMESMLANPTGSSNPFVIGHDAYRRYMEIHRECLLAARTRPVQNMSPAAPAPATSLSTPAAAPKRAELQ